VASPGALIGRRRETTRRRAGAGSSNLRRPEPAGMLSPFQEPPASPRLRHLAPLLLEVDVLVLLVAFCAAGIFALRDQPPPMGIALRWRALPELIAIAAFAFHRLRERERERKPRRWAYPAACATVCALSTVAHAPFGLGAIRDGFLALATGALFGVIGLSV